jgi:hypothetical protein
MQVSFVFAAGCLLGIAAAQQQSALSATVARRYILLAPVCEVMRFLAERGAPVDELDAAGKTPIGLAGYAPIDKAVDLFTDLIRKSAPDPNHPPNAERVLRKGAP